MNSDFFFLGMDFVSQKINSASFDCSFRRNIVGICEKCQLHVADDPDFFTFFEDLIQIDFLKSEQLLCEDNRNILKTIYQNNEKAFLVCNQLWLKFGHEFFYLENHTIKYSI